MWTDSKLIALEPKKLETLRRNAAAKGEADLVRRCEEIQLARRENSRTANRPSQDPVVGFHFVCKEDYEVSWESDGSFRSGVWAVSDRHCDAVIELGGYVALHNTKHEASYRQGKVIGWSLKPRTKGTQQMGVEFHLLPLDLPVRWYGEGSGEKGYRRVTDEPRWQTTS